MFHVSIVYLPWSANVYIMDKYAQLYSEDADSWCAQPISLPQPHHLPLHIPLFPRHHPDSQSQESRRCLMILQTCTTTVFTVDFPAQLIAHCLVSWLCLLTSRAWMLFAYLSSEWLPLWCLFDEGQGQHFFIRQFHLCGFLHSEFLHPVLVTQNL